MSKRDEAPPDPDVDVNVRAVEETLERVRDQIRPEDYALLRRVVKSYVWLTNVVRHSKTTVHQLRRLLGWSSSEKTAAVLGQAGRGEKGSEDERPDPDGDGGGAPPPAAGSSEGPSPSEATKTTTPASVSKKKVKGHGRRAATEYAAAEHIEVAHQSLCPGGSCPLCGRGTLYELSEPAQILRLFGQPPLRAVSWDCQRLRCSACGAVDTAQAPAEAQGGKYAESAVSMMAVLRFGSGVPHHRLDQLQQNLRTPLPASTQWEALAAAAEDVHPVHAELIRQAAQGTVVHNDDTRGPLLGYMGKRREALLAQGKLDDPERSGLFTTAVVAQTSQNRIALFFTGRKHAGENLTELLGHRAEGLDPPIQMSDALTANNPVGATVISSHCLAHARRNFVDEVENFPDECEYLLKRIGTVFAVEKECRQKGLSAGERLLEHQLRSAPVMEELWKWMTAQFDQRRVEPNSGLGKAFQYMLKRWDRFTLFLRLEGVPLDNNLCERALKMAIRHRKNSLFYRTERGAEIGDLYMSLIHTAQLCGENALEYLTALLTHRREVAQSPGDWMPWNWREAACRFGSKAADRQAA